MENLFKVINLDKKNKIGNLKSEAHSQVKSTKYFPIYLINGKKLIFKPLSKTKPLTTPFFAFSEVYWSYIIKKYFDKNTPRYYLAYNEEMENEQSKYYNYGVIVESLTPNDEKMINLYDYFNINPEEIVNIKDYINYCMMNYNYTNILQSNFIKNNKEVGEGLAYQILLSILRQDRNFHYENINLFDKGSISIVPPIDFEFSIPFLYPDKEELYKKEQEKYIDSLNIQYEDNDIVKFLKKNGLLSNSVLKRNVSLIVKNYPDIVLKFIKNLEKLINDLPKIEISDPDNFIKELNSDYWEVGHVYFKDKDLEKYEELKRKIKLEFIDKNIIFERIRKDILEFSKRFILILKTYLISYYNGIEDLENLTIKELYEKLEITEKKPILDIDIDSKRLIFKNDDMN